MKYTTAFAFLILGLMASLAMGAETQIATDEQCEAAFDSALTCVQEHTDLPDKCTACVGKITIAVHLMGCDHSNAFSQFHLIWNGYMAECNPPEDEVEIMAAADAAATTPAPAQETTTTTTTTTSTSTTEPTISPCRTAMAAAEACTATVFDPCTCDVEKLDGCLETTDMIDMLASWRETCSATTPTPAGNEPEALEANVRDTANLEGEAATDGIAKTNGGLVAGIVIICVGSVIAIWQVVAWRRRRLAERYESMGDMRAMTMA